MCMPDTEMVPPGQGECYNFPINIGALLLQLIPSIKSSRNKQVDVVVAWHTASDLRPGYLFSRLFHLLHKLNWMTPNCFLFRTSTDTPWTSHYFRINHLYPLLYLQYLNRDAILRYINITSSHDIPHFFYSMHSYHRGASTHFSRKREGYIRKAHHDEPTSHACWRIKNQGK